MAQDPGGLGAAGDDGPGVQAPEKFLLQAHICSGFDQGLRAHSGEQDHHIDQFGADILNQLPHFKAVLQIDFLKDRGRVGCASMAFNQSRHLRLHAGFQKGDDFAA